MATITGRPEDNIGHPDVFALLDCDQHPCRVPPGRDRYIGQMVDDLATPGEVPQRRRSGAAPAGGCLTTRGRATLGLARGAARRRGQRERLRRPCRRRRRRATHTWRRRRRRLTSRRQPVPTPGAGGTTGHATPTPSRALQASAVMAKPSPVHHFSLGRSASIVPGTSATRSPVRPAHAPRLPDRRTNHHGYAPHQSPSTLAMPVRRRNHQVIAADPAGACGTADNYNPAHPFPAIDEIVIAITPDRTARNAPLSLGNTRTHQGNHH